jgi:hypothetical protein
VTATDTIDGPVPVSCTPASGAVFPMGTTEVKCTARDSRQNTATAHFTVTVVDTMPPSIEQVTPSPGLLWPPNGHPRLVTFLVSASDLGRAVSCRIASVTSNAVSRPVRTGKTEADWTVSGPLTVWLQAEHQGGPDGRVYTVTVSCADRSGNTAFQSARVIVPSSMGWLGDRIWRAILHGQQRNVRAAAPVKKLEGKPAAKKPERKPAPAAAKKAEPKRK